MGHSFGGNWTKEKLERVKAYLDASMTALKNQHFKLGYIDAFAGTGYINQKANRTNSLMVCAKGQM